MVGSFWGVCFCWSRVVVEPGAPHGLRDSCCAFSDLSTMSDMYSVKMRGKTDTSFVRARARKDVFLPSILSWLDAKTRSPHPRTQQTERNADRPSHALREEVVGSSEVGR